MPTPRALRLSLSLALVATLAACGGGGDSARALNNVFAKRVGSTGTASGSGNDTSAPPTVGTTAIGATPATLVLSSAGLSTVPEGSYALIDTNTEAGLIVSRSVQLSFGTLVISYPENDNFDTGVFYVQEHPEKYSVGFIANPESGTKAYACRSSAWTPTELQALADAFNDPTVLTQPVCAKAVTLDSTKRGVTYSDLPLPSADGSADQVVVSATFTWPAPEPIVFDSPSTSVETDVVP